MLKNKQPPTVSIRATMQQQQLASARNRRLAQQMENRPSVQAALKLKQVSGNIPVPFFLPTPPFPSVPTACTVAPDDSSPRQSTTSTPFTGLLPLRWEAGDDVATTRWQNNFLWGGKMDSGASSHLHCPDSSFASVCFLGATCILMQDVSVPTVLSWK